MTFDISQCLICKGKLLATKFSDGIEYKCVKSKIIDNEKYSIDEYVVVIENNVEYFQEIEFIKYYIHSNELENKTLVYQNSPHKLLLTLPFLDINSNTLEIIKVKIDKLINFV